MNKTTIIGDIHGRIMWKEIGSKENDSDRFIFLGDYFDSYTSMNPEFELDNFNEILRL